MTLEKLPGWAFDMLSSERVARLAFLDDDDHPRVLPVTFALADGFLWTAVDQKPKRADGREIARLRYLRRTPDAAVVVDRYDDDWSRLAWLQLLGWVDILDASRARPGLDALISKYAPYREEPPGGPLMRFDVVRTLHWRASEV